MIIRIRNGFRIKYVRKVVLAKIHEEASYSALVEEFKKYYYVKEKERLELGTHETTQSFHKIKI